MVMVTFDFHGRIPVMGSRESLIVPVAASPDDDGFEDYVTLEISSHFHRSTVTTGRTLAPRLITIPSLLVGRVQ